MSSENQIVWVTGASAGIGEAFVKEYAKTNANIVLSARRKDELERVAKETGLPPDRLFILPLDLTNPGSFADAVALVKNRWGRVDILINNGGISQRSYAKDTGIDVTRKIFETNVFGTIELTRLCIPLMQKGSHITVITSLTGKVSTPLRTSYAASKHALHGYFDGLRAELYESGIQVTIVLPGFVRTDVSVNALTASGEMQGTMDASTAAGMPPDELARRVIKAMKKKKREVVIAGPRERLGVFLSRFAPGLLARIVRTAKVT